jgi:hypothetical protein
MKVWTMKVRALAPVVLLCCLGFATQTVQAQQTFSFPNFNSTTGLQTNGSAAVAPNGNASVMRITPATGNQGGSTWYTTAVPLQAGFTTTFTFQFTGQGGTGGHADGIAFVVQHSPTGISFLDTNVGGSIGYADDDGDANPMSGIANSVAIEFDTFTNGWDPNNNHVAIQSCWDGNNSNKHTGTCLNGQRSGMNPTLAINSALSSLNININDGAVHTAIVTYSPPCANCQNLTVLLDGQQVAAATLDLVNLGLDATDDAFVGFTASTGGGFENQDILSWSFSAQTITQPVSAAQPTTFAFNNAAGSELTHTVDFTPPAGQLVYPNNDPGKVQIQSTNTSVDAATWPQYVVGGPFAPSLLFPIVEDNPNGVGTNGALFVDLCYDPTASGSAATPSDANCPFVPSSSPTGTPLLAINVVADLVSPKPGVTPGTTTALAHYEPSTGSNAPWAPSTGSSNPACTATTGAGGGQQPAPPTACNVSDAQNQIVGDQTTSSGRVRSKGTFAMTYGVPMLLSSVTVNGTPVNQPPANGAAYVPLSGALWFSKPLNLGFTVNPACIPGQCPTTVASLANNFFNPAPVAGENFDIVGQVASTPATPTTVPFDTSSARPISFAAQESLSDGQYILEWSAFDNVGILEQNQQLVTQTNGPCPGADPSSIGTQCYLTSLFNAPLNVDSTPPVITSTNSGQTYKAGQKNVAASFSCVDPTPGAGTASCVGNNGSSTLDTTPTGGTLTAKTFSVTGKDKAIPPNSATSTFSYFVSCNYAAVTLSPSTLSKSKLPTLIGITASVTDCMTAPQKVVVAFTLSGPVGKNCSAGSQSMFSTPAFTIKSGTASSVTFPFPILKAACAGTYSITTTTTVQGSTAAPDVVTSTLTITN